MAEAKVTSKKNVEIEQHKSKTAELEMVVKMKDEQLKALEEKQKSDLDTQLQLGKAQATSLTVQSKLLMYYSEPNDHDLYLYYSERLPANRRAK